jgi:hypothetical protein
MKTVGSFLQQLTFDSSHHHCWDVIGTYAENIRLLSMECKVYPDMEASVLLCIPKFLHVQNIRLWAWRERVLLARIEACTKWNWLVMIMIG